MGKLAKFTIVILKSFNKKIILYFHELNFQTITSLSSPYTVTPT